MRTNWISMAHANLLEQYFYLFWTINKWEKKRCVSRVPLSKMIYFKQNNQIVEPMVNDGNN